MDAKNEPNKIKINVVNSNIVDAFDIFSHRKIKVHVNGNITARIKSVLFMWNMYWKFY